MNELKGRKCCENTVPSRYINWANGAGAQATLSSQVMGHRALFVFYFGWDFRVPQNFDCKRDLRKCQPLI